MPSNHESPRSAFQSSPFPYAGFYQTVWISHSMRKKSNPLLFLLTFSFQLFLSQLFTCYSSYSRLKLLNGVWVSPFTLSLVVSGSCGFLSPLFFSTKPFLFLLALKKLDKYVPFFIDFKEPWHFKFSISSRLRRGPQPLCWEMRHE